MSLVTDVFDFIKTNPGVDGMQIQNHFSNNVVSTSLSDLETRNVIRWTKKGYYVLSQQIDEIIVSLEDSIEQVIKFYKENIKTTCPKCSKDGNGKTQVESLFGFRTNKGHLIPQSYCRSCRSNHKPTTSSNSKRKFHPLARTSNFVSAKMAITLENNINIEGVVSQKETKKEFDEITCLYKSFCTAYLIDNDEDVVKIMLLDNDVLRIQNGSRIKILRGYTITNDGETSITIRDNAGLLEVISFGPRIKPKKSYSLKSQIISDQFSFENSIIESTDNVLKFNDKNDFERRREDSKF